MESIQYNTVLAIIGAIRGISREKRYQELGLESLRKSRWYRKLCYFFKTIKGRFPEYLFRILPNEKIPFIDGKHNFSFFPSTVIK